MSVFGTLNGNGNGNGNGERAHSSPATIGRFPTGRFQAGAGSCDRSLPAASALAHNEFVVIEAELEVA
jgi:hypothetical protein